MPTNIPLYIPARRFNNDEVFAIAKQHNDSVGLPDTARVAVIWVIHEPGLKPVSFRLSTK